jgi:hypothetical protein
MHMHVYMCACVFAFVCECCDNAGAPRDLVVAQVEHGELVWKERLVGKLRQAHAPYDQVRVEALSPGLALVRRPVPHSPSTPRNEFAPEALHGMRWDALRAWSCGRSLQWWLLPVPCARTRTRRRATRRLRCSEGVRYVHMPANHKCVQHIFVCMHTCIMRACIYYRIYAGKTRMTCMHKLYTYMYVNICTSHTYVIPNDDEVLERM